MCWVMSGRVMALDRPDDDIGPELTRPERRLGPYKPVADAPAARTEPAEPRTHEEYYEALRRADRKLPDDQHRTADSGCCGWDSVDAADRPPVEAIRVSPERA